MERLADALPIERAASRWIVSSDSGRARGTNSNRTSISDSPISSSMLPARISAGSSSSTAREVLPSTARLVPQTTESDRLPPCVVGPLRSTVMRSEHAALTGHRFAVRPPSRVLSAAAAVCSRRAVPFASGRLTSRRWPSSRVPLRREASVENAVRRADCALRLRVFTSRFARADHDAGHSASTAWREPARSCA